jgi:hypothetical protein
MCVKVVLLLMGVDSYPYQEQKYSMDSGDDSAARSGPVLYPSPMALSSLFSSGQMWFVHHRGTVGARAIDDVQNPKP